MTELSDARHRDGAPIAVGALITLEDESGVESHYVLAPAGGGERLTFGALTVQAITVTSPLGRELVGRRD